MRGYSRPPGRKSLPGVRDLVIIITAAGGMALVAHMAAHEYLPSGEGVSAIPGFLPALLVFALGFAVFSLRHLGELKREMSKRQEATEKVQESEARFRDLVENASDVVWEVDGTGAYTYCSPNVAAILGYQPAELLGKRPFDLMPPDEAERCGRLFAEIVAEQRPFALLSHQVRRKDGSLGVMECSGSPIFDGEGRLKGYRGVDRDITHRMRAEEAEREASQRLEAVIEASPVAIFALDLKDNIIMWNPAAERVLGWSAEEVLGHPPRFVPQNRLPELIELRARLASGGGFTGFETVRQTKSGRLIDVSISAAPLRAGGGDVIGSVRLLSDITENKRAEEARLNLSSAVEQAADSVFITAADGTIEYVNPAFERLTGYSYEEAVGQPAAILKSGKHRDGFYKKLWGRIAAGRVFAAEFVNRKKNGELYHEDKTIAPIRDGEGKVAHFVSTGRDVTARKQAEALARAQAHALEMIATGASLPESLDAIVRLVEEQSEGLLCSILIADLDTGTLRCGAAPSLPDEYNRAVDGIAIGPDVGSCGTAAHRKQMVVVSDIATDPLWNDFRDLALAQGLRACWSLPILSAAGDLLGTFAMYYRTPRSPDAAHLELIQSAGRLARIALEQSRIESALRASEESHRTLVEAARDCIYTLALDGTLTSLNPAFETLTGWPRGDWLGKPFAPIIHPDDLQQAVESVQSLLGGATAAIVELRVLCRSGEYLVAEFHGTPLVHDGSVTGVLGIARDITDRKRSEETIRHLAYHDALTGLPNRTLFKDRLTVALSQAQRSQSTLAVIFLDLDYFKTVNDSLGHAEGDGLLRAVAADLGRLIRDGDTVARFGGDEFALLLPALERVEDAVQVAERILAQFSPPRLICGQEVQVTASIGISIHPGDGDDADALLRSADTAMYQAKDLGRNGYQIYAPAMSAGILQRLTLEKDLRLAVQRKEFVLHYQPIADVATGQVVGVEALVRWQHPERGLLLPGDFIPFAEETGLIQPIDTWVLRTACRQAMSWQEAGLPPLRVAVNLSARLFLQPDMVDMVAEVLRDTGLAPDLLELEITETLAMENADLSTQLLASLDQMGVHVAIDDFGTGYSSLSYLKNFPIDTVKIDRAFVSGVIVDVNDAAITSASIAMAHKLNLEVTAEGVESEEQLAFLREHSCDHYQGYLLSRPVPAGEIPRLLQGAGNERASVPSSSG